MSKSMDKRLGFYWEAEAKTHRITISRLHAEVERLRAELARLAEAGTGYSQQTVDALTKERDTLRRYLPLALACVTIADHYGPPHNGTPSMVESAWEATKKLSPEQRRALMEDEP